MPDDRDDDLLYLREDLRRRIDGRHDLQNLQQTCRSEFLLITHRAEGLRDTHRSVRLVILAVSIHQRLQVIALGRALFVCNRVS